MQISDAEIRYLAYNWFRNSDGADQTVVGGVSLGETIASTLWCGFASIAHFYQQFSTSSQTDLSINLPSDSSRLMERVAAVFFETTSTAPAIGNYPCDELLVHKMHVPIAPLSSIFRFVQRPFRFWIRRKRTLVVPHAFTKQALRKNGESLEIFRKSIFLGAAPRLKKKFIRDGETIFGQGLVDSFSYRRFVETLKRQNADWDRALIDLCVAYAEEVYVEMRPHMIACFALYSDLLENYKPDVCVLPPDSFPIFVIMHQVCRMREIRSLSYVDGYPLIIFWPIARDQLGEDWIVDHVAAYDLEHKDAILKLGFPESRILLAESPFSKLQIRNTVVYDFIIMSWFANCFSMDSDHTSPVVTMKSVLDVVISRGAKSIAIKIKSGDEKRYVIPLIKDLPISVDILEGNFYEHVNKTKAVIGGISTAWKECACAEIPYFVFEPYANGYSDEWINRSLVVKIHNVARTPDELKRLITEGDLQDG